MRKSKNDQLYVSGANRLSKAEYDAFKQFNANATVYKKEGRWHEACEEFKKAHLLKPRDVYLLNNIGDMLNRATDFIGAIEYFSHTLKIDPSNAYAQKGIEIAKHQQKKYPSQSVSATSTVRFFHGSSTAKAHQTANGKTIFTYNSIKLT